MGKSPRSRNILASPCGLPDCKNTLFELARDAILIADIETGFVCGANKQAETLFGLPREKIIGMHQSALHPPDATTKYREAFARHVAADGSFTLPAEIITADGSLVPVEINSSTMRRPDGRMVIQGIFRDVSWRKRAEEAQDRHATQLKALANTALEIGKCASPDALARLVAGEARQIVPAAQAGLEITPPRGRKIRVSANEQGTRPEGAGSFAGNPHSRVRKTNAPLRKRRGGKAGAGGPGDAGWLGAPIVGADGRNAGLLFLAGANAGEFAEQDEAIVLQLARMTSVALDNLRLLEETAQSRAEMEALTKRLIDVQESERRHLARELHDEIGQLLTGLSLTIGVAARDGPNRRASLDAAAEHARTALRTVRHLSSSLRPAMLDDLGLVPTLTWYLDRYREQTGIRAKFRHEGVEDRRFGEAVETAAYRIVQESLTNVARHAGATSANVSLSHARGELTATIRDSGTGFDVTRASEPGFSNGISGMRERAVLLGGDLDVESRPGHGTRIVATLPAFPLD